jgi:hypothetical protein
VARERILVAAGRQRWLACPGSQLRDDVDLRPRERAGQHVARLEPHVVAVGVELGVELGLDGVDQSPEGGLFFAGSLEVRGWRPAQEDERVPGRDRLRSADRER